MFNSFSWIYCYVFLSYFSLYTIQYLFVSSCLFSLCSYLSIFFCVFLYDPSLPLSLSLYSLLIPSHFLYPLLYLFLCVSSCQLISLSIPSLSISLFLVLLYLCYTCASRKLYSTICNMYLFTDYCIYAAHTDVKYVWGCMKYRNSHFWSIFSFQVAILC